MAIIKSPRDIHSVSRNRTLVLGSEMYQERGIDGDSPLKYFSDFSRFLFCIINEEKRPASTKMRIDEIPDLLFRSKKAYEKQLDYEIEKISNVRGGGTETKSGEGQSAAYSMTFWMGSQKGKTPVQVLQENPDTGAAILNKEYLFLQKEAAKYQKNGQMMNAIAEAMRLLKEGKIKTSAQNSSVPQLTGYFQIYHSGFRPLIRKVRQDGKVPVKEMSIMWNYGQTYPVEITISNYYAIVNKTKEGLLNVLPNTKQDELKNFMRLSASEWICCITKIEEEMKTFQMLVAADCRNISDQADYENRKNAKTGV